MYVIFDNLKVEIFHQEPDLNHTFSDWFETRQFDLVKSKTDWANLSVSTEDCDSISKYLEILSD